MTDSQKFQVKVVALQYSPILKDIAGSQAKVDKLIAKYSDTSNIDVLILPELSFQGGYFSDVNDVLPYSEVQGKGKIFQWCTITAQRLKCIVVVGYSEITDANIIYNSMYVVSDQGVLLQNYRKHQLFFAEVGWATPGYKFEYLDALVWRHEKIVRFGLGICNDIWYIPPNEFGAMNFAQFHEDNKSQIILHMSNWPDYQLYSDDAVKTQVMMSYWLNRLIPITQSKVRRENQNVYFVQCNRIGTEFEAKYVGSSCVFQLKPDIEYLDFLDSKEENVIEANLELEI
eukprot:403335859